MATQQSRAYQPLIFLSWVVPGNCLYNNPFPLGWWRVVHLTSWPTEVNRMLPARKNAKKTPLKSTKFISNDYCRICRINLKISGRSKINIFGSKRDNGEFLKTLSLVLLSEPTTDLSQIVCQKCQREVLKFSRVLEQGKELTLFREKCKEAFRNQLEEYNLKRQKRCAKDSPTTSLDRWNAEMPRFRSSRIWESTRDFKGHTTKIMAWWGYE